MFSLFSIVTFPNQGCASQDSSARNGTCYTSSECQNKGGTTSGNCAAGYVSYEFGLLNNNHSSKYLLSNYYFQWHNNHPLCPPVCIYVT